MAFNDNTLIEKLALIISVLASILFIVFGLNQILGFFGPLFIGKSFLIANRTVAGIIDLLLAIVILVIEFQVIKISFLENYLYRGIMYFIFAFILSTCATIAVGGLLYIIANFMKK